MNTELRTLLSKTPVIESLPSEDLLIILSLLYEGSKEDFEKYLIEKTEEEIISKEQSKEYLLQFEELQAQMQMVAAEYTESVNQAYEISLYDLLEQEIIKQKEALANIETQYQMLLSKTF